MKKSLSAMDLEKNFGQNKILQGVNLELDQGEFIAIVGKSGVGKSTLLGILGAQDMDFKGKLFLDGINITEANGEEIERIRREYIGFVFQDFHLLPNLSPLENTILPAVFAGGDVGLAERNAKEVLSLLGVRTEGKASSFLSRGEKQRVAVARGLVRKPVILLADEPTASLDEETEEILFDLLEELKEKMKFSLVAVIHSRKILERADRILRLENGKLEECSN